MSARCTHCGQPEALHHRRGWLCWLGLHRWGAWGGIQVLADGTQMPSARQSRFCSRCHAEQRRCLR